MILTLGLQFLFDDGILHIRLMLMFAQPVVSIQTIVMIKVLIKLCTDRVFQLETKIFYK